MSKDSSLMGFHKVHNKANRSVFDLSRRNLFTSKIGELFPVFCEEVIPGDEFNINLQHFSRTMPVQTAAFTRLRENIQFFYVPYTALYYRFRECMTNMTRGQNGQSVSRSASSIAGNKDLTTALPYITIGDIAAYFNKLLSMVGADGHIKSAQDSTSFSNEQVFRLSDTAKLLQSLGYGNFTTLSKIEARQVASGDYGIYLDGALLSGTTLTNLKANLTKAAKDTTAVSPFRLLAYHRIANDFYRYFQWQSFRSYSCNVDYLNGVSSHLFAGSAASDTELTQLISLQRNIFDMEYSNLPIDFFNGSIPNQQFGDESVVNLGGSASGGTLEVTKEEVLKSGANVRLADARFTDALGQFPSGYSDQSNCPVDVIAGYGSIPADEGAYLGLSKTGKIADGSSQATNTIYTSESGLSLRSTLYNTDQDSVVDAVTDVSLSGGSASGTSTLSIIALRRATALQRYKEIQNCHDADFVDQIQAHFGVKPKSYGDKAVFLGGDSNVFDINPQINQNLTGDNNAEIKAAPTSQGSTHVKFRAKDGDYGVIIGLYRCTPQLDYAQTGIDPRLFNVEASDYPIPELDSIGMQEAQFGTMFVPDLGADLYQAQTTKLCADSGVGFVPRYYDWKLSKDTYQGAYLSTLKTWVTGQSYYNLQLYLVAVLTGLIKASAITPALFVCSPQLVKDVFVNQNLYGGIDNDQFMIGSYIDCSVKRNLSRYGLPY